MSLETVQHCDLLPRTAVVPKGQGDLARTITKEDLARRLNSALSEMFDAIQPERALSLAAVLFSPHPKLVVMQPPVRRQVHNGTSCVGLWLVVRAQPLCHVPDGF